MIKRIREGRKEGGGSEKKRHKNRVRDREFFFLVGLGFELNTSCWQSRYCTT
jgi:hypothetical protein